MGSAHFAEPNTTRVVSDAVEMDLYNRDGSVAGITVFDLDDLKLIEGRRWGMRRTPSKHRAYAVHQRKATGSLLMHRVITKCPTGLIVDHVNGDGLDNRRTNLRVCTYADNNHNHGGWRRRVDDLPRGVQRHQNGKKWGAHIYLFFDTPEEAIAQRRKWEDEFYGEFAYRGDDR